LVVVGFVLTEVEADGAAGGGETEYQDGSELPALR
jgi:hypothetical protein